MPATIDRRSTEALGSSSAQPFVSSVGSLVQAIVVGALLITAFWPILKSMYGSWFDEHAYMEHGILVIPATAYMVWTKRAKLKKIPRVPSAWGVPLLLWGALQALLGLAAQWTWVGRMAFLVSLVGCIIAWHGLRIVRELVYPLCTLILMVAPPSFVYARLTLDLQLIASRLGESFLEGFGFSVMREGNILRLVGTTLSVEEACSGIQSLVSIFFMCTLYNYFFVKDNVIRTLLILLAIPVAILGNAGRIIATGVASQYNRELVDGTAHEVFGYVSVVLAAIGCVVLHLLMVSIQKRWKLHFAAPEHRSK